MARPNAKEDGKLNSQTGCSLCKIARELHAVPHHLPAKQLQLGEKRESFSLAQVEKSRRESDSPNLDHSPMFLQSQWQTGWSSPVGPRYSFSCVQNGQCQSQQNHIKWTPRGKMDSILKKRGAVQELKQTKKMFTAKCR